MGYQNLNNVLVEGIKYKIMLIKQVSYVYRKFNIFEN